MIQNVNVIEGKNGSGIRCIIPIKGLKEAMANCKQGLDELKKTLEEAMPEEESISQGIRFYLNIDVDTASVIVELFPPFPIPYNQEQIKSIIIVLLGIGGLVDMSLPIFPETPYIYEYYNKFYAYWEYKGDKVNKANVKTFIDVVYWEQILADIRN